MSLTLVTAPTQEPVTLEMIKAQLRLDIDDDDDLLREMLVAARTWVEGQTKRAILQQTWDYDIDGNWPMKFGSPRITLPLNPVQSVTSIVYDDGSPRTTLAASQYTVSARTNGSYIVPAYGVDWPTIRDVPSAVTVRFVAGYTTVPQTLKRAIALLVAHFYEQREPTVVGTVISDVPLSVESLISPYRAGLPG